jgi:hypothetical protein
LAHPDATAVQRVATTVSWNAVIAVLITPAHRHRRRLVVATASPAKAATRAATASGNRSALPLTQTEVAASMPPRFPAQRARTGSPPRRC